jgi:hypothetical protein
MIYKKKLLLNFLVVIVLCLIPMTSPHSSTISAREDFQPRIQKDSLPTSDDFVPLNSSGIESDDFNSCSLDTDIWTFINPDPVGDGSGLSSYEMTGTFTDDARITITIPSGENHTAYPPVNTAPRIMQAANNTDFEL